MRLIPTNLAKIADVAADKSEANRFALDSVRIVFDKDESYMVEATDKKALIRVTGKVDDADCYPTGAVLGLDEQPDGGNEALIQAGAFRDIMNKAKKATAKVAARKPVLGNVAVAIDTKTNSATLAYTSMAEDDHGTILRLDPVEGRYPPTAGIVSQSLNNERAASFRVSARRLAALMTVIASLFDKYSEAIIDFHVPAKHRNNPPICFEATTDEQKIFALLMPCTD